MGWVRGRLVELSIVTDSPVKFCRSSSNNSAISFADDKTGWKSSTDAECTVSGADECRNALFALEAIGTKAWTSSNSATCVNVPSNSHCRHTSKLLIPFANNKTGWKSSADAECTLADSHTCRNSTSGAIESIGVQAWTSNNSAVCSSVTSNTQCRSTSN